MAVFGSPPVRGLGNAGGFKIMIEDRGNEGLETLQEQADDLIRTGNQQPGLVGLFTVFRANTPQLYVDIDRTKCKTMGVALNDVFDALQVDLGGLYVNDFNQFGRTWQVNAQADIPFRMQPEDVRRLQVRNAKGDMVPLGTVAVGRDQRRAVRHQSLQHVSRRRRSTAVLAARHEFRPGDRQDGGVGRASSFPRRWASNGPTLMYLQIIAGNTTGFVFAGAVVLVFLVLAGQYESWSLPLAVIFVVPMCILCSVAGVAHAPTWTSTSSPRSASSCWSAGQQERHPHRGIRQGETGVRHAALRGHAGSLPAAAAADHDDLVRLHPGRAAAGALQRRRRRNAANPGHRRVQRHVGRDAVRHLPHAGLLLRDPVVQRPPDAANNVTPVPVVTPDPDALQGSSPISRDATDLWNAWPRQADSPTGAQGPKTHAWDGPTGSTA